MCNMCITYIYVIYIRYIYNIYVYNNFRLTCNRDNFIVALNVRSVHSKYLVI